MGQQKSGLDPGIKLIDLESQEDFIRLCGRVRSCRWLPTDPCKSVGFLALAFPA